MTSNIGYSISPFMDQTELTNVTIGNNVKIISPCLFSGCSSLSDNIDTKYNLNGTISNDNNGIKIIKCKNGQYKKIIKHM